MRWLKRKRKPEPIQCQHHLCQCCGGIVTRQTTLDEFDSQMFLHKGQRLITEYEPQEPTERIGIHGKKRKRL